MSFFCISSFCTKHFTLLLLLLNFGAFSQSSDSSCWNGPFNFENCCGGNGGNAACWDGVYTYEKCCSKKIVVAETIFPEKVDEVSDEARPVMNAKEASTLEPQGPAKPEVLRKTCQRLHLLPQGNSECWFNQFQYDPCCLKGHLMADRLLGWHKYGGLNCWSADFTREHCCETHLPIQEFFLRAFISLLAVRLSLWAWHRTRCPKVAGVDCNTSNVEPPSSLDHTPHSQGKDSLGFVRQMSAERSDVLRAMQGVYAFCICYSFGRHIWCVSILTPFSDVVDRRIVPPWLLQLLDNACGSKLDMNMLAVAGGVTQYLEDQPDISVGHATVHRRWIHLRRLLRTLFAVAVSLPAAKLFHFLWPICTGHPLPPLDELQAHIQLKYLLHVLCIARSVLLLEGLLPARTLRRFVSMFMMALFAWWSANCCSNLPSPNGTVELGVWMHIHCNERVAVAWIFQLRVSVHRALRRFVLEAILIPRAIPEQSSLFGQHQVQENVLLVCLYVLGYHLAPLYSRCLRSCKKIGRSISNLIDRLLCSLVVLAWMDQVTIEGVTKSALFLPPSLSSSSVMRLLFHLGGNMMVAAALFSAVASDSPWWVIKIGTCVHGVTLMDVVFREQLIAEGLLVWGVKLLPPISRLVAAAGGLCDTLLGCLLFLLLIVGFTCLLSLTLGLILQSLWNSFVSIWELAIWVVFEGAAAPHEKSVGPICGARRKDTVEQTTSEDALAGNWNSFYDLLPEADDSVFLQSTDGRQCLSYKVLKRFVSSEAVQIPGIANTDRLCTAVPNGPEAAICFLAFALRYQFAPLNLYLSKDEFLFEFDDLPAKVLITQVRDNLSIAEVQASSLAISMAQQARVEHLIELHPCQKVVGIFSLAQPKDDILLEVESLHCSVIQAQRSDIALVLHTSGTTRKPKIVPLTHGNIACCARCVASTLQISRGDVCMNAMPLFHIHGLTVNVLVTAVGGAQLLCLPGVFEAALCHQWLSKPTWYSAVPTIHLAVLNSFMQESFRPEIRLELIRNCSAALVPALAESMENAFAAVVMPTYGMTEALPITSNPRYGKRKLRSVGPAAGPKVQIMSEDSKNIVLKRGAEGEVAVQGACVTSGYEIREHMERDPNHDAFSQNWLRTGDSGWIDAEGYLYLIGRFKELINRAGEKISPFEVEDALQKFKAFNQVIAFAAPHETLGEVVGIGVVLKAGKTARLSDVRKWLQQQNSLQIKWLPEIMVLLPKIPSGPTGKPARMKFAEKVGMGILTGELVDMEHAGF